MIFVFYFFNGLFLFCRQAGTYWVEVFNTYTGGNKISYTRMLNLFKRKYQQKHFITDWAILLTGATICVVMSYFYGVKNITIDIEAMLGPKYASKKYTYVWFALWSVLSPLLCIGIVVETLRKLDNIRVGSYIFPNWTLYFGQIMQFNVMFFGIIASAIYIIIKTVFIDKKVVYI